MNIPELSLCFNPDQEPSFLLDLLKTSSNPSLKELPVHLHPLLWKDYKEELTALTLQHKGPDVSQVGFPLAGDLISMNALLPIPAQLIAKIGGEHAFHPTVLKIAKRHQQGRIWTLPWLIDPRALFYWKDLVDEAGVNPDKDFSSVEGMEAACARMKAQGIENPWVLGMADKFVVIHAIVSWVWGKGGDFISPDGDQALFTEENALDGMAAFFRLGQYMPPENHSFTAADAHRFFIERKAAITMGPYGSLSHFRAAVSPELRDLVGVAMPPGPPLLAGSDLVLWRHSRKDEQVADLVSALFSEEVQVKYAEYVGDLPVTIQAIEHLAESGDPNIHIFIEILNKGRLFAAAKFAGMLEVQLAAGLTGLWARSSQDPSADQKETIKRALEPVQRRFDMLHRQE